MNTHDLRPAALHLRKGQIHRLHGGIGQRIESLSGCVWITIDNDRRDLVVQPGAAFTVDRRGELLISAIDDASILVLEPVAPGSH